MFYWTAALVYYRYRLTIELAYNHILGNTTYDLLLIYTISGIEQWYFYFPCTGLILSKCFAQFNTGQNDVNESILHFVATYVSFSVGIALKLIRWYLYKGST